MSRRGFVNAFLLAALMAAIWGLLAWSLFSAGGAS
jgi:hypothetical protein